MKNGNNIGASFEEKVDVDTVSMNNFGDIIIPIDKWFGTFNDGSMETRKKK